MGVAPGDSDECVITEVRAGRSPPALHFLSSGLQEEEEEERMKMS